MMNNKILEKFEELDDDKLVKSFHILFGNLKNDYSFTYKVNEMKSIFKGGTQPCVPFENWVKLIDFLNLEVLKV